MATVTSLTKDRIQELLSGWQSLDATQDELLALISLMDVSVGSWGANVDEFKNVTLPQFENELSNASIQISDISGTQIPNLEAALEQHDLNLANLNNTILPELQLELEANTIWVLEFQEVTVPALEASLSNLNDTVLPDLATRLEAVEAGGGGFDPTPLLERLDDLEGLFPIEGVSIAGDTITAAHILANTITASEIAADTITAMEIAADTITANEIASHTITALEIFADTITANEIAADTITANEIAADTITANEIAADTITAAEIATGTITAAEILAHTITANEIAADTITANEIASNAITTTELNANAVTAAKLAAGSVSAVKMAIGDFANYIADGDLSDVNFTTSGNWDPTGLTRFDPVGGLPYLQWNPSTSAETVRPNNKLFETLPTEEFYFTAEVSAPASNTVNVSVGARLVGYDFDGVQNVSAQLTPITVAPNTGWTTYFGTIVVPAGMTRAKLALFGGVAAAANQQIRIRNLRLRKKAMGSLIVDGSIISSHVSTVGLDAAVVKFGQMSGDRITANSLNVNRLAAGVLNANVSITAGVADGKRVALDATGTPALEAWATAAQQTVNIDGVDNWMTGRLSTAQAGTRVVVHQGDSGGAGVEAGEVAFYHQSVAVPGTIRAFYDVTLDEGSLHLRPPGYTPGEANMFVAKSMVQVNKQLNVYGPLLQQPMRSIKTRGSTQSIATATWDTISWNEDIDTSAGGSWSYSAGVWTINVLNSLFRITASVTFPSNATGTRGLRLLAQQAAGILTLGIIQVPASSGAGTSLSVTGYFRSQEISPGSIWVEAYQNSGGALAVTPRIVTLERIM